MLYKIGLLINFSKIHRKTPLPELLFNKVTYPTTLLKEKIVIQVFFDEFCLLCNTSVPWKIILQENTKEPSEKRKKLEIAGKKNNDTRRKKILKTLFRTEFHSSISRNRHDFYVDFSV